MPAARPAIHLSVKLRHHLPIPHAVDPELKNEAGAIDAHVKGKVEVVKLDATRGGEAREERAGHLTQIGGQRADRVQQARLEGDGRPVGGAREHLVRHHERLPRAKVARVGEGHGVRLGDELVFAEVPLHEVACCNRSPGVSTRG